jgi:hypothetical protein
MSIVLMGSTSGSCTLQEQAVAGTSVITLPVGTGTAVVNGVNGTIVSGTAVTPSGTSVDFTGIPSWAKRITVMFSGVSLSGTDRILVQIGSGSIATTGYTSTGIRVTSANATAATSSTAGMIILQELASDILSGSMVLTNITGNTWISNHTAKKATSNSVFGGGDVTLGGVIDRLRITTVGGTDTFDAGSINILYE